MEDNSDNSLNVAIIGYGNIAKVRHRPNIKNLCCIIDNAIDEEEIDGIKVYKTLEQAINAGVKIDAVSICTPPDTHAGLAKDALKLGCHVLLEKPPVLEISELDELEQLSKEKGKVLFLAYHTASSPAVLELQKLLRDKNVISIEGQFLEQVTKYHQPKEWIFKKDDSGGGVTRDIGINAISAICKTLPNANFRLVDAKLEYEEGYSVDTEALINLVDSETGIKVTLRLDWFNGEQNPDVRRIKYTTEDEVFILDLTEAKLYKEIEDEEFEIETGRDQEYKVVYREFSEHVKNGQSYIPKQEALIIDNIYSQYNRERENNIPLS